MGLYNVVGPCVVGKLHYTRPTTQPIEVDDAVAAPGVEAGCLEPYMPGGVPGKTGTVLDGVLIGPESGLTPNWHDAAAAGQAAGDTFAEGVTETEDAPKPRPRGRRRTED